jgi:diguanylate cyclase (GGDEF)-like protein
MFRLLRYFSIASLITVVLAAVGLGAIYRQIATRDLLELGERNNVVLTQTFANSLWPQFRGFAASAAKIDAESLQHHPETDRLHRAVVEQMRDTHVVKVKLYDLKGRTLFSTETKQIGRDAGGNAGFQSARHGVPASELAHRDTFSAFEQQLEDRDMLSSYVALRGSADAPIEGVLEIYTDVTSLYQSISEKQRLLVLGVVAVLSLLYGVLFLIVRHADLMIKRQYDEQRRNQDELRGARENLERRVQARTADLEVINQTLKQEVLERQNAEQRIQHMAYHDALTGLPNRLLLQDRVAQALMRSERHGVRHAVVFIDLDNFKNINDSLGHHIGDQVLQAIAKRLAPCVRETDTVARIGGDEFFVSLADMQGSMSAGRIARKLLEAISLPIELAGQQVRISASIGVAIYPEHGQDVATLLRNADAAMYSAKKLGRNRCETFEEHMNERLQQRIAMENAIRLAIEKDQFLLYFQPVVALESGAIVGAEALLRWQTDQGAWIPPSEFIPVAEECGLIVPLGEWVINQACEQLQAWRASALDACSLAINLSPRQFSADGLAETVVAAIERTAIDPSLLHLEITESLLMSQSEVVIRNFETLQDRGIRFSIDDFGTGYSSLGYLKHFPPDVLKIDRLFVRDLPDNRHNAAIVTAVVAMAKSLGIKTVAEGTETPAQVAFLRQLGCNNAQGFLFGRPMPAADFVAFALDRRDMLALT